MLNLKLFIVFSRYFQSQGKKGPLQKKLYVHYRSSPGLFAVPTRIVFIATPTNAFLNWLLGKTVRFLAKIQSKSLNYIVWGPGPIRMGFIGAPIATAISFNLISIMSICYGIFFTSKTAWHPISSRMFKGFGILISLGISGVGE